MTRIVRFLGLRQQIALALFAGVATGGGVGFVVATHLGGAYGGGDRNLPAHFAACPGPGATIGYIVALSSGQSMTGLPVNGHAAIPMESTTQRLALVAAPEVKVPSPGTGPAVVPPLPAMAGVDASGAVLSQARESDLRSCNYTLADRPAAQVYLGAARTALLQNGLISAGQASNSPAYMVSDDPLNAKDLIVTVDVEGPQIVGGPGPANRYATLGYAVVLTRGSEQVVALGEWPS
jgi:hypothetical protein